jgi:Fe-S-cluster-containing hydrogenase component 2
MRQELDALKRQVALRPLRQDQAQTVQVDAALCTGCGECVPACPQSMFELEEASGHPLAHVMVWTESERTQACAECQLGAPPCITVCAAHAIVLP